MKYSDTVQSARCLFLWPLKQPDCEPVSGYDWLNRPRCALIGRPSISSPVRLHIVCLSVGKMEDSREGRGQGGGLENNVTLKSVFAHVNKLKNQPPILYFKTKQSHCVYVHMGGYGSWSCGAPSLRQYVLRSVRDRLNVTADEFFVFVAMNNLSPK